MASPTKADMERAQALGFGHPALVRKVAQALADERERCLARVQGIACRLPAICNEAAWALIFAAIRNQDNE